MEMFAVYSWCSLLNIWPGGGGGELGQLVHNKVFIANMLYKAQEMGKGGEEEIGRLRVCRVESYIERQREQTVRKLENKFEKLL